MWEGEKSFFGTRMWVSAWRGARNVHGPLEGQIQKSNSLIARDDGRVAIGHVLSNLAVCTPNYAMGGLCATASPQSSYYTVRI